MHDTDLRRLARDEQFDEALDLTEADDRGDIGDELLRLMHRGLLLHYAGEYEASNTVLQRAEVLAEDRFTRSVSKAALSMVTSDRVLAWVPNDTERLMINYYGALNYLALGNTEEAAVEARRLSRQLELSEEEELAPAETDLRRALRYFAGSVFEAAGDRNNAAVAYRHVWPPSKVPQAEASLWPRFLQLYGAGAPEVFIGPPAPAAGSGGDLIVLVERGFIAHRVERSLNVPLFPEESSAFDESDESVRQAVATCVAFRAFGDRYDFTDLPSEWATGWRTGADGRCIVPGAGRRKSRGDDDDDDDGDEETGRSFYLLRVAWPEMVSSGLPGDVVVTGLGITAGTSPVQAISADDDAASPDLATLPGWEPATDTLETMDYGEPASLAAPQMSASLSNAAITEFEDRLGGILVKAVARSAVKYSLARGVEKELKKKDELLGDIALLTANAAAALLERADTRCWHLLPDRVSVVRLRLPPGRHPVSLRLETARSGTRVIDLGEIDVRDGTVRVLSARIWP